MSRQFQKPLDPHAGYVAPVDACNYPSFPSKPLDRIRWAMEAPLSSPTMKAVLVCLALHADRGRGRAWVSAPTIARMTSLSLRAAKGALRRLQADGWIAVVEIPGRRTYRVPQAPAHPRCGECGGEVPADALGRRPAQCLLCGVQLDLTPPTDEQIADRVTVESGLEYASEWL